VVASVTLGEPGQQAGSAGYAYSQFSWSADKTNADPDSKQRRSFS